MSKVFCFKFFYVFKLCEFFFLLVSEIRIISLMLTSYLKHTVSGGKCDVLLLACAHGSIHSESFSL